MSWRSAGRSARGCDVHLTKPRPLVSRRWSFEVRERLDAEGKVLEPLDTEAVRQTVRQLKAEDVEAIVCCFLHSYVNPAHERLAADIIRMEYPEAFLSVSSDCGFPIPFGMTLRMRECSLPARGCDKMYPALGPLDTFQRPLYAPQARQTQSNRGGGRRCTSG